MSRITLLGTLFTSRHLLSTCARSTTIGYFRSMRPTTPSSAKRRLTTTEDAEERRPRRPGRCGAAVPPVQCGRRRSNRRRRVLVRVPRSKYPIVMRTEQSIPFLFSPVSVDQPEVF